MGRARTIQLFNKAALMSFIGKNIKKIRTVKKINQVDFAELFGLARASVGSYEEGRAEPKVDTIIAIANHFGISIDLLLKKELTVNELYRFDIFRPELLGGEVAEPKATLQQPESSAIAAPGIPLISASVVGEYVVLKGTNTFTAQQPQLPAVYFAATGRRGDTRQYYFGQCQS